MFQFPTGWNSTLLREKFRDGKRVFQFPTGWNSTAAAVPISLIPLRFNSQRDGILPQAMADVTFADGFQFPTGWNSTKLSVIILLELSKFQFPTGWNSTGSSWIFRKFWKSFNSQRDGILLRCYKNYACYNYVSIPNGMEFYSTNFAIFLGRKC